MKTKIHPKIKSTLGFDENISDKEFKSLWKKRATQVCKPCWELKYCPYGPFVEQSPLLPLIKSEEDEHIEYLRNCLKTNTCGSITTVDREHVDYLKKRLQESKKDNRTLLIKVLRDLRHNEMFKEAEEKDLFMSELLKPPLDNFEKYQVPFPLYKDYKNDVSEFEITKEIQDSIDKEIDRIETIIATGIEDGRTPLDKVRRKWFEDEVNRYNPEDQPESIPAFVKELSCNIFGHICPVVFVGESLTETSEERRKGRYIPFKTKIRVVRRDNYTCQHCGCHLKDDEVEFDHIIPLAKGGSSEEHNIRLTCYDCNRDKSDNYEI